MKPSNEEDKSNIRNRPPNMHGSVRPRARNNAKDFVQYGGGNAKQGSGGGGSASYNGNKYAAFDLYFNFSCMVGSF